MDTTTAPRRTPPTPAPLPGSWLPVQRRRRPAPSAKPAVFALELADADHVISVLERSGEVNPEVLAYLRAKADRVR